MGDRMSHTLICPNQARTNGVIVDDVPQHLSHDNSSTHSIYFPNEQVRNLYASGELYRTSQHVTRLIMS